VWISHIGSAARRNLRENKTKKTEGTEMKVNKWTMSLAALGLISIPATGLADEKMNQVWTALSSTTLSGYVNTSVHWNTGTGNESLPVHSYNTASKADGFNLDVVKLALEKPLDEAQWAAGYKVELLVGGDAAGYGTTVDGAGDASSTAIKQAYVSLRAPVGNGLDFKVGVFDTIIGYETFDSGSNPNYTRSYGFGIEPTTHTGVLASYQVSKAVSLSAGIANTWGPTINTKANPPKAESYKSYMGSLAQTAPEDWGFIGGSTLYAGIVNGYASGVSSGTDVTSYYLGATLNTPVKNLKVGASFDFLDTTGYGPETDGYARALAVYTSLQATEKLSLHLRGEYAATDTGLLGGSVDADGDGVTDFGPVGGNHELFALTGTLQYDLWKNVISRLEIRWDHLAGDGDTVGFGNHGRDPGTGEIDAPARKRNNVLIAANLIYKF
jgi:hypothetical protein